jgi:hypothetical protein
MQMRKVGKTGRQSKEDKKKSCASHDNLNGCSKPLLGLAQSAVKLCFF